MSEHRLNEIRARCDAATPGPWEAVETKVAGWEGKHGVKSESGWDIVPCQCDWEGFGYGASDPDAAFIANSREDIPYLLAEIERLTARAEAAEAERDAAIADLRKCSPCWLCKKKCGIFDALGQRKGGCCPNFEWRGPQDGKGDSNAL